MNDPTNWNPDPSIKSIEVENPAMAKEMEKRWNAYPGLVAAVKRAAFRAETSTEAAYYADILGRLGERAE